MSKPSMQCAVISMAVILLLWCELIKAGEITRDHPVLLWLRLLGPRKIKVHMALMVNFKSLPTPHRSSYRAKKNASRISKLAFRFVGKTQNILQDTRGRRAGSKGTTHFWMTGRYVHTGPIKLPDTSGKNTLHREEQIGPARNSRSPLVWSALGRVMDL